MSGHAKALAAGMNVFASIRSASAVAPGSGVLSSIGSADAVMVDTDGATVTGELADNPGVSYTTLPLASGQWHPISFNKITAVSGTAVAHAGWY